MTFLFAKTALFAPFGSIVGDSILSRGQYVSSQALFLSPAFPYFGRNMTSLYINNNGFLSFMMPCNPSVCFNSRPFPFESPPLIAPLWTGYTLESDTSGDVYYRIDQGEDFLSNISSYIQIQRSESFVPSYAVVVTWFELPQRFSSNMGPTNTFQAILATDGYRSYVILSYGSLEVELDLFAGFNFGDGLSFVDISTNGIADRSNVLNDETLGRYLYRVNGRFFFFN